MPWCAPPAITNRSDADDDAHTSLLRAGSRRECEIAQDCSANALLAEPKVAFSRGYDDDDDNDHDDDCVAAAVAAELQHKWSKRL